MTDFHERKRQIESPLGKLSTEYRIFCGRPIIFSLSIDNRYAVTLKYMHVSTCRSKILDKKNHCLEQVLSPFVQIWLKSYSQCTTVKGLAVTLKDLCRFRVNVIFGPRKKSFLEDIYPLSLISFILFENRAFRLMVWTDFKTSFKDKCDDHSSTI